MALLLDRSAVMRHIDRCSSSFELFRRSGCLSSAETDGQTLGTRSALVSSGLRCPGRLGFCSHADFLQSVNAQTCRIKLDHRSIFSLCGSADQSRTLPDPLDKPCD